MVMFLKKLKRLICFTLLLTAVLPALQRQGVTPFTLRPALAQPLDSRKAEADRLLQQGRTQYLNSQHRSALQSWQQALELYRTLGNRQGEAVALNYLGSLYDHLGQYQKAIEHYQQALVVERQSGDRQGEGTSLRGLGGIYFFLGQYQKANDFFQQSLAIARKIGNRQQEAAALGGLGGIYLYQGQYSKAIEVQQQTLRIAQEIGHRKLEIASLSNLGGAYLSLQQYREAIDFFQQSLTIAREIGDRRREAIYLNNLGNAYLFLSQYPQAIEFQQQSLLVARENGYRRGEAASLNGLGMAYAYLGQYQKAIEIQQQSMVIAREIGDRHEEMRSLEILGFAYHALGQYPQLLEVRQQSLVIAREVGHRQGQGASLGNLGVAHLYLDQYPQAIDFFQQALAIAREIGDRQVEAAFLGNLGIVYSHLGQYSQAINFQQQTLAIAREIGDRQGEATSLDNLGTAYAYLGQYQQSIEFQQQSLAMMQEIRDRAGESRVLSNLGLSLFESGDPVAAEEPLFAAIQIQESLRQSLSDANKISIFETQTSPYLVLQEILVAQNRSDEALEIAERGRARAFVELLAKRLSNTSDVPSGMEPPSLAHIQNIARMQNATLVEYSIIGSRIREKSTLYIWVVQPTGSIHARQVDLSILSLPLNELIPETRQSLGVRNRGSHPQPAPRQRLAFAPGNWVRLHSDAPDSEPWEVVKVNSQSGTLSLTQSSFPQGVTIERPASDVAAKVETRRAKNLRLQQLHQVLIDPIADLLPADPSARVIFMPQRELFLVPFPALQDAQGTYLIEQHTILTAPAIQVLDLTRQRRQRLAANTPHSSSVFRPPSSILPSPSSILPSPSSVLPSPSDLLIVGNPTMPKIAGVLGEPPQPLTALPHAEQEAREIAQLLQTTALTGNQVTKAAVLAKLPAARAIHLATHGLLDDRRGLGSAIALAPAAGDDGLLTAEEILDLNLKAELVVLSACNTGKGRITGDGVIGLSRALIHAGVPSVIVSLWTVPDAPTASLMTAFYENLQQSGDKAQALRQAMLTTMQHHPDPRDWAAFTLIGEAE